MNKALDVCLTFCFSNQSDSYQDMSIIIVAGGMPGFSEKPSFSSQSFSNKCDWYLNKACHCPNRGSNLLLLGRTVEPVISVSALKTTLLLERPSRIYILYMGMVKHYPVFHKYYLFIIMSHEIHYFTLMTSILCLQLWSMQQNTFCNVDVRELDTLEKQFTSCPLRKDSDENKIKNSELTFNCYQ